MDALKEQFINDIANIIFNNKKDINKVDNFNLISKHIKFNNNFLFVYKSDDNRFLSSKSNFEIRKLYANSDVKMFLVPQYISHLSCDHYGYIYKIEKQDSENNFNITQYNIVTLYFDSKTFYELAYNTLLDYIYEHIIGKKCIIDYNDDYLLITNNFADQFIYMKFYCDQDFVEKYKDLLMNGVTYNNFIITLEGTTNQHLIKLILNHRLTYSLLYYLVVEKGIDFSDE